MDISATTDEAPTGIRAEADFCAALEAAKLAALYQFAYGLSHEINNPLANIATRAQTLIADEKDPERRRKLATIVQQAFKAHEMIADLMLFARPPTPRTQTCDLVKLADAVVGEMQDQAAEQGTRLTRVGAAGPLLAVVDATQIAVALKALMQNSLEAMKQGGSVEVSATSADDCGFQISDFRLDAEHSAVPRPYRKSESRDPGFVLAVSDTGPGIPAEIRRHIFDPFFSGREAGRGLGLGLSKAWRIVDLHRGYLEVASQPGRGTKFTIFLPSDAA
jgi:signal transduction histidine kinase